MTGDKDKEGPVKETLLQIKGRVTKREAKRSQRNIWTNVSSLTHRGGQRAPAWGDKRERERPKVQEKEVRPSR